MQAAQRLPLDGRAPYLADHQPGGVPLLPTALCLEALAAACAQLRPGLALEAQDIRVAEPCLVPVGMQHDVQALLETPASDDGVVEATLFSTSGHGECRTHMRARFRPQAQRPAGDLAGPLAGPLAGASVLEAAGLETPVPGATVYRQFFHGPAWQVVASAGWQGGRLVARLATGLPPLLHPGPQPGVLPPRLVELALQSAGLLEIACSGRSMIPHAIDSVRRFLPLDEDSTVPLLAIARRAASSGAVESGAIDIDVCTTDGRAILGVRGYRTLPLPFASDPRSLADLATALRAPGGH
jgi:hypothetical protein